MKLIKLAWTHAFQQLKR